MALAKKTATRRPVKAPTTPGPISVELYKARETKGTFRYETDDEDAPVQTLYVKKTAKGFDTDANAPQNITLIIQGV